MTCNDHPAGHNGYVSPAIKDKGIHSVFYMDGPAGIGRTAWPTEMLLACAFNKEAWYRFGAVSYTHLSPVGEVIRIMDGEKIGESVLFHLDGMVPGIMYHLSINEA